MIKTITLSVSGPCAVSGHAITAGTTLARLVSRTWRTKIKAAVARYLEQECFDQDFRLHPEITFDTNLVTYSIDVPTGGPHPVDADQLKEWLALTFNPGNPYSDARVVNTARPAAPRDVPGDTLTCAALSEGLADAQATHPTSFEDNVQNAFNESSPENPSTQANAASAEASAALGDGVGRATSYAPASDASPCRTTVWSNAAHPDAVTTTAQPDRHNGAQSSEVQPTPSSPHASHPLQSFITQSDPFGEAERPVGETATGHAPLLDPQTVSVWAGGIPEGVATSDNTMQTLHPLMSAASSRDDLVQWPPSANAPIPFGLTPDEPPVTEQYHGIVEEVIPVQWVFMNNGHHVVIFPSAGVHIVRGDNLSHLLADLTPQRRGLAVPSDYWIEPEDPDDSQSG